MNTNTKYWSFTWQTNAKQKTIPNEGSLSIFFNGIADYCTFQYEIGDKLKKEHIQGHFTLSGLRQSKTKTLDLFKQRFKNISGLTISPVYDKLAIEKYTTKEDGRIKGPYYCGKQEKYDMSMTTLNLYPWQKTLFKIMTGPQQAFLKDRKVIWVEDACGNTGKSVFLKWLRTGQKQLLVRKLPVNSVDRLLSAINLINKQNAVDLFVIDLTRTQAKTQSFEDLFAAIEDIKNGYTVDVMYGKYNETTFDPPMIAIFTNNSINEFRQYLSDDRWQVYKIGPEKKLASMVDYNFDLVTEELD